jgi:hypothetical protein
MDASTLRAWCQAKRGRAALLAKALNISRVFVTYMAHGKKPIPERLAPLIEHEIKRAERVPDKAAQ